MYIEPCITTFIYSFVSSFNDEIWLLTYDHSFVHSFMHAYRIIHSY